jgi:hypothetical protein
MLRGRDITNEGETLGTRAGIIYVSSIRWI